MRTVVAILFFATALLAAESPSTNTKQAPDRERPQPLRIVLIGLVQPLGVQVVESESLVSLIAGGKIKPSRLVRYVEIMRWEIDGTYCYTVWLEKLNSQADFLLKEGDRLYFKK